MFYVRDFSCLLEYILKDNDSNSSEIITNTIHSVDHLANILVELSKIYSELFTIDKNSVMGKVLYFHHIWLKQIKFFIILININI